MPLRDRIKRWLWGRFGTEGVTLGGRRFEIWRYLPSVLRTEPGHERWLDAVYERVLGLRSGAFIDVGVNRGQTYFKLLRLDPGRRYVGFEPQVGPSFMVQQFIVANGLAHHAVVPIGLSDAHGLLPIRTSGTGYGSMFSTGASLIGAFRPESFYSGTSVVAVAPGDEVLPLFELDEIALVKIDVEGAELEVVAGLSRTLEAHRPYVVFEVLHHYLAAVGEPLDEATIAFRRGRLERLEATLRALGYLIYHVDGDRALRKVEVIAPQRSDDLSSTDYVAVPSGEEAAFVEAMRAHYPDVGPAA